MTKSLSFVLALALMASSAHAAAESSSKALEIKVTAEVEVKIKAADGAEQTKRVPAAKVPPGVAVIYTLSAQNTSQSPAGDVAITDPIPQHMQYVDGSATTAGTVLTFSVDGGKTFAAVEKLKVKGPGGASRSAGPTDFTHIRWQFQKPLAPGESRAVEFRARVE
jgi:uncharacterized repeat protein (TIGR01451 family)